MGTNFYILNGKHIGKRSAAGLYCWDCKITLCKDGKTSIHQSKGKYVLSSNFPGIYKDPDWYEKCPICGKLPDINKANAAFKELGFSKVKGKQTGVSSCCSFTWAIESLELKGKRKVKDEYNRIYTMKEFWEELDFCPIQFYDKIGENFS
jgi:hypothetical protein